MFNVSGLWGHVGHADGVMDASGKWRWDEHHSRDQGRGRKAVVL